MGTWIKEGGSWKEATIGSVKVNGKWVASTDTFMKVNGRWENTSAMPTTMDITIKSPKKPNVVAGSSNALVLADGVGQWKVLGYGNIASIKIIRNELDDSELITDIHIHKLNTVISIGGMCRADAKQSNLKTFVIDDNAMGTQITSTLGMFSSCRKLETIDFGDNDYSRVKDFSLMFQDCSSLVTLDLSKFMENTKGDNFHQLFNGCSSLVCINILDTSHVAHSNWNTQQMFHGCTKLVHPDAATQQKISTVNVGFRYEKGSAC